MTDPPDDPLHELRRRAVGGDAEALSELCEALQTPVFRLALRMLGDRDEAEDVTQDILVKVLTHLASFEGRSRLTTWVHTIAVRHLQAHRQGHARHPTLADFETFSDLLDRGLAYGQSADPVPEDRVLVREVRLLCTQGMLQVLGPQERLALILVDLLGFDGPEAAEICEVEPPALRKRLSRARQRLGTFLRSRCGVANPSAACQCPRQIPAKTARGLSREGIRLSPLMEDVAPSVRAATEELKDMRTVVLVLGADRVVHSPATLRQRLRRLLPTVLGLRGEHLVHDANDRGR